MQTVLVLTFTEVARDPRVLRHVEALKGDYAVVTCGKGPGPEGVRMHFEIPDGASHLPLTLPGLANLTLRRTEAAYRDLPAARAALRLLRAADFDAVLTNDVETLPVGLILAGDRPVVADLHEYAPRLMEEDWRWRALIQPFVSELCERYLPQAGAVVTVAPGIAAAYRDQFGVKVHTVVNAGRNRHPTFRPAGTPVRLVHSGMATPNRRIENMINAAAGLAGVVLDLYLVPALRETRYLRRLAQMAARTRNVRVREPVPVAMVPQSLDPHDVGLALFPPTNFNNLHGLPNKFFDYVQSGLGILVGPSPEMAPVVRAHGMGAVFTDFDPRTWRAGLQRLTPELVDSWKRNSARAAEQLNSDRTGRELRGILASALA